MAIEIRIFYLMSTLRVFSKRNSQKPKASSEPINPSLNVRRKSEALHEVAATNEPQVPRSPLQSKLSQELGQVLQQPPGQKRESGKIESISPRGSPATRRGRARGRPGGPPRGRGNLRGIPPKSFSSPSGKLVDNNQKKLPQSQSSPHGVGVGINTNPPPINQPPNQPPKPPPRNIPAKPETPIPKIPNTHLLKPGAAPVKPPTSPNQIRNIRGGTGGVSPTGGRQRSSTLDSYITPPIAPPRNIAPIGQTSQQPPGDFNAALWRAVRNGNETELKNLLQSSKDFVNSEDTDGDTPLSFVAHNTNIGIAKILLAHNASPSKATKVISLFFYYFRIM